MAATHKGSRSARGPAISARSRPYLARAAKEGDIIYKQHSQNQSQPQTSTLRTAAPKPAARTAAAVKKRTRVTKFTLIKSTGKLKGITKAKSKAKLKPKKSKAAQAPAPRPKLQFECELCNTTRSEDDFPTAHDFPAECHKCAKAMEGARVCWDCARRHISSSAKFPWAVYPSCFVCYREWNNFDFLRKYLTEREIQHLENRLTQRSLEADPAFRWCASDKCSFGQIYDITKTTADPKVCCGECSAVNCIDCRTPWHEGMTCEEYQYPVNKDKKSSQIEAATLETMRKSMTKRCTRCRVAVEKIYGCDHMTCEFQPQANGGPD